MAKKGGLGKGLNALFLDNEAEESGSLMRLRLSDVEPNKDQPRDRFDQEALQELADSIREHGVLQPIVVRAIPGRHLSDHRRRASVESLPSGGAAGYSRHCGGCR